MDKAEYNAYKRKMRALTRWEYEANPTYCLNCGKKIDYEEREKRFCNSSCATSHNNRGVQRNGFRGIKLCPCGNPVSARQNKWCDECIEKKAYNQKTFEQLKTDKVRREWLLRERGHRCEMCGNTEWLGYPITIELDHIDGNADNNAKENLRLLCPNCHSLTPFWKGRVKGKEGGRYEKRRKRYADGETW